MRPRVEEAVFSFLSEQSRRPPLFSAYTAEELWTEPHVAEQMLRFHLDPDQDIASRNHSFIQRSIEWLKETFHLAAGKRVLDLGCGPGLYANGLAEESARVTGVDFSSSSLAHARSEATARGLPVTYREANYLDLHLDETFDLILLIFGDFCPLSPEQRRRLLDRVKGWLAPGGRFVFDVSTSALFQEVQESAKYEAAPAGGFWSSEPHFVFTHRFTYPDARVYLDRFLIIEADRTRDIFNWIQCYDRDGLEAELREAGWRVESTFGDLAGGSWDPEAHFFAVVTRPSDPGSEGRS